MKAKNLILAGAMTVMAALPAMAQNEDKVVINGSLIDWYYYGKDIHSSAMGWFQQPTGGGAWIDDDGVAHPTGESNYGLMSLIINEGSTSRPLLPEFLIRNHILYSNCSGVYVGGNTYYSFFGHEANFGDDMGGEYGSEEYEILIRKWTWDDGYTNVKYQQVGKIYQQPTDLCYDPVNDVVYGVFNISSGNETGYKVGTIDMETFRISYISREAMPMTGELRCLAINSKGQLYGIDASGNFYSVSKEDGQLNFIGNVGFKSQRRMMSATFDLRTDKLYWLGYMNNGKNSASTDGTNTTLSVAEGGRDTGIYEINVETGEATLIGKTDFKDVNITYDDEGYPVDVVENIYGKMELTGIYVENSFTRAQLDLKASFKTYPVQMKAGEQAENNIVVNVKNTGLRMMGEDDWSVVLLADGEQVARKSGRDLEPGEVREVKFTYNAPRTSGQVVLKVQIESEKDELAANDFEEVSIMIQPSKMVPAVALTGEAAGSSLTLKWQAPNGRYTEDAESYVPFTYDDLAEWIMYDGDGAYTQRPSNFNASIDYANWSTPKAYIVMNPVKAGFDLAIGGERFNAHSGSQYFAAFWGAVADDSEAGGHQVANDDWMISPRLNGEAQTISFWARGYKGTELSGYETEMKFDEKMRVLYTTSEYTSAADMDLADWQVARDVFVVDNSAWTQYTAELPAGARHFALQCCSDDGYVLMIDDIEFNIEVGELTGYNIYKNGTLLETVSPETLTKTVRAQKTDAYTVTALYGDNESLPSNAVGLDEMQGISPAVAAQPATGRQIFNVRGQQLQNATAPGVYIFRENGTVRKAVKR